MLQWNLRGFLNNLVESSREFDIADNIQILYKDNLYPIVIDGVVYSELKVVKGSYCIYHMDTSECFNTDNEVEILAIEEYSDSPNSIYIDKEGRINSNSYTINNYIRLADKFVLYVQQNKIVSCSKIKLQNTKNYTIEKIQIAA